MGPKRHSSVGPQIEPPKLKFPSCCTILTGLAFYAFFNVTSLRCNLNLAIVAMLNQTAVAEMIGKPLKAPPPPSKFPGTYVWSPDMQGIILGSFYYSYIATQIPGGLMAQKIGGKWMMWLGMVFTVVPSFFTPLAAKTSDAIGIIICRLVEGFGQGVMYPAMHVMLSEWAAPVKRSQMATAIYAGGHIGCVLANILCGQICEALGWEYVFYIFGIVGAIWCILWIPLVYDSPQNHPRIEEAEKEYILKSQGITGGHHAHHGIQLPWREIARSPAVYAITVAHVCNNWAYYLMISCGPTYMSSILKFDLKSNGLLSGLPYLVMWLFMVAAGQLADFMRGRGYLSTTVIRKSYLWIGCIIPGVMLILEGFMDSNVPVAVFLLFAAIGVNGVAWASWAVNHLDLAPPYAGTLMGITNTVATIPGMINTSVVGAFTKYGQTIENWRKIFYLSGGIFLFGCIFFQIFGSGKRQAWANPPNIVDADDEAGTEYEKGHPGYDKVEAAG